MDNDPLPNESQRKALGELLSAAFTYMRYATWTECRALAYALHNIPVEIYGWGTWDVRQTRGQLRKFQAENYSVETSGPDFVAMFDEIFPSLP
jgi:hypothetical protein